MSGSERGLGHILVPSLSLSVLQQELSCAHAGVEAPDGDPGGDVLKEAWEASLEHRRGGEAVYGNPEPAAVGPQCLMGQRRSLEQVWTEGIEGWVLGHTDM